MQYESRNFRKSNLRYIDQSTKAVLIACFLQLRHWSLIRENYCAILEPVLKAHSKITSICNPEQSPLGSLQLWTFQSNY